jgi:hypothetical protein
MLDKAFEVEGISRKEQYVLVAMNRSILATVADALRGCTPNGRDRSFIAAQALGFQIGEALVALGTKAQENKDFYDLDVEAPGTPVRVEE